MHKLGKALTGFDTGYFARGGGTVFFKKFWKFSDSYNNFKYLSFCLFASLSYTLILCMFFSV